MVEYSTESHDLLFSHFSRPDVELLLSVMEEVSLRPGDVLFSLDESGDKLFLVAKGRLSVQKRTGFGERTQVVALLNPGAPVGERFLFNDNIHGSTVVAVDESIVFSLSKQVFDGLKKEHPLLALNVLELLLDRASLRLRKNSDRLSHVL